MLVRHVPGLSIRYTCRLAVLLLEWYTGATCPRGWVWKISKRAPRITTLPAQLSHNNQCIFQLYFAYIPTNILKDRVVFVDLKQKPLKYANWICATGMEHWSFWENERLVIFAWQRKPQRRIACSACWSGAASESDLLTRDCMVWARDGNIIAGR